MRALSCQRLLTLGIALWIALTATLARTQAFPHNRWQAYTLATHSPLLSVSSFLLFSSLLLLPLPYCSSVRIGLRFWRQLHRRQLLRLLYSFQNPLYYHLETRSKQIWGRPLLAQWWGTQAEREQTHTWKEEQGQQQHADSHGCL